jgi:hypothetical protein
MPTEIMLITRVVSDLIASAEWRKQDKSGPIRVFSARRVFQRPTSSGAQKQHEVDDERAKVDDANDSP